MYMPHRPKKNSKTNPFTSHHFSTRRAITTRQTVDKPYLHRKVGAERRLSTVLVRGCFVWAPPHDSGAKGENFELSSCITRDLFCARLKKESGGGVSYRLPPVRRSSSRQQSLILHRRRRRRRWWRRRRAPSGGRGRGRGWRRRRGPSSSGPLCPQQPSRPRCSSSSYRQSTWGSSRRMGSTICEFPPHLQDLGSPIFTTNHGNSPSGTSDASAPPCPF